MSRVTNTILAYSILEDVRARFDDVNRFFETQHRPTGFWWGWDDTDAWVGGSKSLEQPTFVAAFNHLDLNGLIKHIRKVEWEYPDEVQLIVCDDGDSIYKIVPLFGLGLKPAGADD